MESAIQIGFTATHRAGLLLFSVALLALVLELVRRRRFKERYALLWLAASIAGLVVGIFPGIIVWLARLLHVQFLTVFFALAFVFLLGLVLSFSVIISKLTENNRELAQEIGLLAQRITRLEKNNGRVE